MTTLYYLAYGSNLHPLRLQERVESARLLGTVQLPGFQLRFHKVGADGSGKCNMLATEHDHDTVHAALFSMHARHKAVLDEFEESGYESVALQVDFSGARYPAFVYIAECGFIDDTVRPFHWYKQLVLHGARHHNLPGDYVAAIDEVHSVPDSNTERDNRHARLLTKIQEWT